MDRVAASGARFRVDEIAGGRAAYQLRSLRYLWRRAGAFDVVLAQEMLRGALNATAVGVLKRVPVVTYMGISPIEYFRCRRERGQIGALAALGGELAIRTLMRTNGALASRALVMGPYLAEVAAPFSARVAQGRYYGVDTALFRPASAVERLELRRRLDLPRDRFLVLLSSRISHEKDPETVLRAAAMVRARGVDAVVMNLGGGHREFLALAHALGLESPAEWVLARPAVHPMEELADYYRAADVLAQGSLAEGLGLSPLEALACETPVVATAIGGMAAHLGPYAALTPRRDAAAMADAMLSVAFDPGARPRRSRAGPGVRAAPLDARRRVRRAARRVGGSGRGAARHPSRRGARMTRPRVAVVSDLREEHWPSMDLVAEVLISGLEAGGDRAVDPFHLCPPMTRRLTRVPWLGQRALLNTTDRVINRYWDYPRWLRGQTDRFDLFHIVDHSYAHLASTLPAGRSIVMCHDVDAFAGVLPGATPPSAVSRVMGRRLLAGLRAAARVVCGSRATHDALLAHRLVDASRAVVVPYGAAPRVCPGARSAGRFGTRPVVRPARGRRARHPARGQHHSAQAHRRPARDLRRPPSPSPGRAAPAGRRTADGGANAAGRAARRGRGDRVAAVSRSADARRRLPSCGPGAAAVRA